MTSAGRAGAGAAPGAGTVDVTAVSPTPDGRADAAAQAAAEASGTADPGEAAAERRGAGASARGEGDDDLVADREPAGDLVGAVAPHADGRRLGHRLAVGFEHLHDRRVAGGADRRGRQEEDVVPLGRRDR